MRILVDMDGIVADLLTKWLQRYNDDWNDCLSVDMIDSWDISECVMPRCGHRIFEYIHEPGFFADLAPLDGAISAVAHLAQRHEVKFATAPAGAHSAQEKLDWIDRHFKGTGLTKLDVFVGYDKHWLDADLIIDDKPKTLELWKQKHGGPRLTATIEYPYNIYAQADCLATDWKDPAAAWDQILTFIDNMEGIETLR